MNSIENLGSDENPIQVRVNTDERAEDVIFLCEGLKLAAEVEVDPALPEDIEELLYFALPELAKITPEDMISDDPKPNNFCPCNSGKKYKKCCMANQVNLAP